MFSVSDCPCSPWQAKHVAARSSIVSALNGVTAKTNARRANILRIGNPGNLWVREWRKKPEAARRLRLSRSYCEATFGLP
jgi:hypothetical protein